MWKAKLRTWLADMSHQSLAQRVAGAAFLIRLGSAAVAFASQIFLARWMGSSEYGIFVYVWSWVLLIGGLDLGLASSALRFIPEYSERRNFGLLRGYLSASRWLVAGLATITAALGGAVIVWLGPYLDPYTFVPLVLACVSLPLFSLSAMNEGIARSYNWVHLALVPPYIIRPLLLLVLIAGAYQFGFHADAVTAMLAAVAATWLTALYQLFALNRRLSTKIEDGPKDYAFWTWFALSAPIFIIELLSRLLLYTDILILKQFRPSEDVAIYFAATKVIAIVAFVNFSVSAAVAHRFAEYHVAGNRERLVEILKESIRWTFWPSVLAVGVIVAMGPLFLELFGPRFVEGYPLLLIFAAGLLARAAVGPLERLLIMLGQHRACVSVSALAFAIAIGACFLLIPHYGVYGAACATSGAMIVESLLLFLITKSRLGLHGFIALRKTAVR